MRPVHILIIEDERRSATLAQAVARLNAEQGTYVISARDEGGTNVVRCLASALPEGEEPPESIQLFPPGEHTIYPSKDGKPSVLTVRIDAKVAQVIRDDFLAIMAESQAGRGAKPFFDFNHEDRDAAAWVQDVYWAGEDPRTGGIRAKVEWSKPGAEAVTGKAYRQFSPNFRVSKETGAIVGTSANMGGLVNRPAFRGIEPFFAKDGGADGSNQTTKKETTMNELQKLLVTVGLLSAVATDEASAIADFNNRWAGIKAKLTKGDEADKQVAELTAKITAKDADIKTANDRYATLAEQHAETVVAKAVDDQILAPKDEEAKTRWKATIKADPKNADLLLKTFNVAAKAGASADPTRDVVPPGSGSAAAAAAAASAGGKEHSFTVLAKAVKESRKCSDSEAMIIAARENPAVYEAYRKGLLYVPEK